MDLTHLRSSQQQRGWLPFPTLLPQPSQLAGSGLFLSTTHQSHALVSEFCLVFEFHRTWATVDIFGDLFYHLAFHYEAVSVLVNVAVTKPCLCTELLALSSLPSNHPRYLSLFASKFIAFFLQNYYIHMYVCVCS